jgi:hypothetical protein
VNNVRVTKVGVGILAVLAFALAVSLVSGGAVRFVAVGIVALILLMLVGEGLSGGIGSMNADAARKREVLSRGAKKRRFDDEVP